jgi:hypothetical protein
MGKGKIKIPTFLWAGLIFGLMMALAFAFTLNNLGIIMRMKSTYMVYFYLVGWTLIVNIVQPKSGDRI